MKKILILSLLLSFTYGQIADYTGISTANENNPAYMISNYESDYQNLGIETTYGNGDFGLIYEPDRIFDINYIAKGEKQLFDDGIFSGYVAFHQQELGNKMWTQNRNPYVGFPFLLADSSIGDMKLNGIHWQLGYSHKLMNDKLFLGGQLFYNVDENMKITFPKPILRHRDYAFSFGSSFKVNQHFQSGLQYTYFDFEEMANTNKYSLDQDKTPVFFKIRGMDNPIILRGKTAEERKQTQIGHNFKLDTKIEDVIAKEINLLGEIEYGKIEAVDGGNKPIDQGTMETQKLAFAADFTFEILGKNEIVISSFGESRLYNADHPDLKIEVFEYKRKQLGGAVELMIPLSNHLKLSSQVFGSSQFLKREDKFNGILDYFPSNSIGAGLGIALKNFRKINQEMNIGYSSTKIGDSEIFVQNPGWYYTQITAEEERFYNSDSYNYWIDYQMNFHFRQNNYLIIDIRYQSYNPLENDYFKDYRELSVGLKFEIRR